jgi:hypothetical protein
MSTASFDNLANEQLDDGELEAVSGGCFLPFFHHRGARSLDISYSVDIKISATRGGGESASSGASPQQPPIFGGATTQPPAAAPSFPSRAPTAPAGGAPEAPEAGGFLT